jgi:hypothetical protein
MLRVSVRRFVSRTGHCSVSQSSTVSDSHLRSAPLESEHIGQSLVDPVSGCLIPSHERVLSDIPGNALIRAIYG